MRTEANPSFLDEVREVSDPNKRVVLVCNMGGNLDPAYAPSKFGMQSRRAAFHSAPIGVATRFGLDADSSMGGLHPLAAT